MTPMRLEPAAPRSRVKHSTTGPLRSRKTCVNWPLQKRQKIGFQYKLSLNADQKYCRMLQGEHSAILSTFIMLHVPFVITIFVLSIFVFLSITVHYAKYSVAEQTGLSLTWSETPRTDFLSSGPILTSTKLVLLLSCQPRVTVISCFVFKVIRDLESIDHLCIYPMRRIVLIHKRSLDAR